MRIIDADKLKRTMAFTDAECLYDGNGKYLTEVIQFIQDKIDEQPTITIEPNIIHACWERVNPMIDTIECSYCGYQEQSMELATPYCGWCGAIMDNFETAEDW